MIDHPLIGRIIERIAGGEAIGRVAHIYTDRDDGSPWAVLVRDDGTFTRSSLHPGSTTRVRAEPTSAAPDDGAPYRVEPATPPATIATLRARVRELEAQLEAQLAGARAVAQTRSGKCVSGDGMTYSVCRWSTDNIYVELDFDGVKTGAVIPRVDILAALGIRGDL
jgi:hypothetical protein